MSQGLRKRGRKAFLSTLAVGYGRSFSAGLCWAQEPGQGGRAELGARGTRAAFQKGLSQVPQAPFSVPSEPALCPWAVCLVRGCM